MKARTKVSRILYYVILFFMHVIYYILVILNRIGYYLSQDAYYLGEKLQKLYDD